MDWVVGRSSRGGNLCVHGLQVCPCWGGVGCLLLVVGRGFGQSQEELFQGFGLVAALDLGPLVKSVLGCQGLNTGEVYSGMSVYAAEAVYFALEFL